MIKIQLKDLYLKQNSIIKKLHCKMLFKALVLYLVIFEICSATLQNMYLNTHNQLRQSETEASPALPNMAWDPTLASSSQTYANKCIYEHSFAPGVGENLAYSASSAPIASSMVESILQSLISRWVTDEKGFNSAGDWACCKGADIRCCHYTQVMWRSTNKVGCAYSQCDDKMDTTLNHSILLVCQYTPYGNIAGQYPYN